MSRKLKKKRRKIASVREVSQQASSTRDLLAAKAWRFLDTSKMRTLASMENRSNLWPISKNLWLSSHLKTSVSKRKIYCFQDKMSHFSSSRRQIIKMLINRFKESMTWPDKWLTWSKYSEPMMEKKTDSIEKSEIIREICKTWLSILRTSHMRHISWANVSQNQKLSWAICESRARKTLTQSLQPCTNLSNNKKSSYKILQCSGNKLPLSSKWLRPKKSRKETWSLCWKRRSGSKTKKLRISENSLTVNSNWLLIRNNFSKSFKCSMKWVKRLSRMEART